MAQLNSYQPNMTFRGTVDEVFRHRGEIPVGATVELRVFAEKPVSVSAKTLAEALQEIGTVSGLPTDLSTNPDYMQGFGETKPSQAT